MATLKEIAKDWASELREGIAWVLVWKTGRSWNAQAVWLDCESEKFEPEDLELARKVLKQDVSAVMLNGYYCGHFFEEMTVADVAAAIRWHYENAYNQLWYSNAFPDEQNQDAAEAGADGQQAGISLAYMDDLGVTRCGDCGAELLCNGTGDMPDTCPHCGKKLEYDFFTEPDGPDADRYRTHTTTQDEAGTAAEAASKGRETTLGTPDKMAGTDTTATTDGQQAAPQGPQGATDGPAEVERDNGRQPGGP